MLSTAIKSTKLFFFNLSVLRIQIRYYNNVSVSLKELQSTWERKKVVKQNPKKLLSSLVDAGSHHRITKQFVPSTVKKQNQI